MTVRKETPLDRAELAFSDAGLSERSARGAARMLFETGMSFESAAVLGQRVDEASTATPETIRQAAEEYRRAERGKRSTTGWGRQIEEEQPRTAWGRPVTGA